MKNLTQKKLVTMAMLAGLSIVLMYLVHFPLIPGASFLEYDMADVPILIGTFLFGPVSGLILAAIVSVIQGVTVSAASGWIGIVMHLIATGTFVIVAGLFYRWIQTRKGAVLGLVFGSIAMTAIMIPLNLIFTVMFLGVPHEAVVAMLAPAIIPFNLLKAGINSVLAFFVYKPVSKVMKLEKKDGIIIKDGAN
jgi:riboflavin transporter FmnP